MIKNAVAGLVVITVSYAFAAFVIQTLSGIGDTAPAATVDEPSGAPGPGVQP